MIIASLINITYCITGDGGLISIVYDFLSCLASDLLIVLL